MSQGPGLLFIREPILGDPDIRSLLLPIHLGPHLSNSLGVMHALSEIAVKLVNNLVEEERQKGVGVVAAAPPTLRAVSLRACSAGPRKARAWETLQRARDTGHL